MSDDYVKVDNLMTHPWFRKACVQETRRRKGVLCANESIRLGHTLTGRERVAVLKEHAAITASDADDFGGLGESRGSAIQEAASEHGNLPQKGSQVGGEFVPGMKGMSRIAWVNESLRKRGLGRLSEAERQQWR